LHNSVCGDKTEVEAITTLTNFWPKKSRSGLLSNSKGGSGRGDSTLFGGRIFVKEIRTERESRRNLFLRGFSAPKKSKSESCWGSNERGRREPVRYSFEQRWQLMD